MNRPAVMAITGAILSVAFTLSEDVIAASVSAGVAIGCAAGNLFLGED